MSKRVASRREKNPRKTAFVPLTLLACAGAGAGVSVIPVCVAGMAGCTVSSHINPAFTDYLDATSTSSGYDASDGGLGDVNAHDAPPGFDLVSDAGSDTGLSDDAALLDDAASDVVSPEPPDAEPDGAKDASGVDP